MSENSIAIIGAGVFGLSTALSWRSKHPSASVFLIDAKLTDHSGFVPASEDTAKIIRTAYSSHSYATLASEALEMWQTERYSNFWHGSGWVVADSDQALSITPGSPISQERFRELFPGADIDAEYIITEDGTTGWVDASKALKDLLAVAVDEGVIYIAEKVVDLLRDDGHCMGVRLQTGRTIFAESSLVAMGCWTPSFLHDCGVIPQDFLFEIAGVTVLGIQLKEAEYERYRGMPILAVPGKGEIQVLKTVRRLLADGI